MNACDIFYALVVNSSGSNLPIFIKTFFLWLSRCMNIYIFSMISLNCLYIKILIVAIIVYLKFLSLLSEFVEDAKPTENQFQKSVKKEVKSYTDKVNCFNS